MYTSLTSHNPFEQIIYMKLNWSSYFIWTETQRAQRWGNEMKHCVALQKKMAVIWAITSREISQGAQPVACSTGSLMCVCQNKRRISATNDRTKRRGGRRDFPCRQQNPGSFWQPCRRSFNIAVLEGCVGYLSAELWLEEQTQRLDRCGPTTIWGGNRDFILASVVSVLPERLLANAFCGNRLNMSLLQGHRKSPVFIVAKGTSSEAPWEFIFWKKSS